MQKKSFFFLFSDTQCNWFHTKNYGWKIHTSEDNAVSILLTVSTIGVEKMGMCVWYTMCMCA